MNLFIIILVSFSIVIYINCYLSIHTPITCIVRDLGALRVAQDIQVMSFLQDDK